MRSFRRALLASIMGKDKDDPELDEVGVKSSAEKIYLRNMAEATGRERYPVEDKITDWLVVLCCLLPWIMIIAAILAVVLLL